MGWESYSQASAIMIKSIHGYLHRKSLFNLKDFSIRLHIIKSADVTKTIHNHPFNYLSIVLFGSYKDLANGIITHRKFLSILYRDHSVYHQVIECDYCITLFFTFGKYKWDLKYLPGYVQEIKDGIYLSDDLQFIKFKKHWYIPNADKEIARTETRFSIFQDRKYFTFLEKL